MSVFQWTLSGVLQQNAGFDSDNNNTMLTKCFTEYYTQQRENQVQQIIKCNQAGNKQLRRQLNLNKFKTPKIIS